MPLIDERDISEIWASLNLKQANGERLVYPKDLRMGERTAVAAEVFRVEF